MSPTKPPAHMLETTLEAAFNAIAPSIVGLGPRISFQPPGKFGDVPRIIGTGFVVDSSGLVLTAGHIGRILMSEQSTSDGDWLPAAWLNQAPTGQEGVGFEQTAALIPVLRTWQLKSFSLKHDPFYGDEVPDIAMVQLGVRDLPSVRFAEARNTIRTGRPVAFAGFPMGDTALNLQLDDAPPVLLQTMPFLRQGIISSVHPFPCPLPHGFTIDAISQGGASGSPIFVQDSGEVVGMLYAAFEAAAITYALPSGLLQLVVREFLKQGPARTGTPTLQEFLDNPSNKYELQYGRPTVRKPPKA